MSGWAAEPLPGDARRSRPSQPVAAGAGSRMNPAPRLTMWPRSFTIQSDADEDPIREGWRGMELRDALTQISEIRRQMARTEVFRGYRAVPVAFSGLLALAAAALQAAWIADPAEQMAAYLALWVGAAGVGAGGGVHELTLWA